ncbi:SDR family oxidoreductase [Polyangium mundeleinium]|uniref:SDR family oxidoreductase n=1 Tax=Polyangium mundeleinium TaxID=2995306 RepID=A0ABT5EEP6_9BACT|nr:SDR family oxidoreductase [Polyangium mundeleinium]MDC0740282.1 SDR family oxidoreductase [Polyangium mundeleinium]
MSQNVFVTGTNSGFGRLITLTLAKKGHTVFATMRDITGRNAAAAEELTKAGEGRVHVLEMAATDDASVNKAVAAALEKAGHLDVVVNNAGYAALGLEETLTSEDLLRQYDVNVVGPHRVLRAALPSMRARGKGFVVQISSALGRLVFPVMGAYGSSKFALEALSEAYRYELKATGVELTIVQPGAFPTEFGQKLAVGGEQERAQGYGPFANALEMMGKSFEQMFSGDNVPSPQLVADAVLALVESPAGSRPARVVVDPTSAPATEGLNKAHAEVQKHLLAGMGMGNLAD